MRTRELVVIFIIPKHRAQEIEITNDVFGGKGDSKLLGLASARYSVTALVRETVQCLRIIWRAR